MFGWFRRKKRRDTPQPPAMAMPLEMPPVPDGYWVFTKEFDREVSARDLRAELEKDAPVFADHLKDASVKLRETVDQDVAERAERFVSRWRSGHSLGDRPLVTILADHSGSLRGELSEVVARILLAISSTLEAEKIDFEVLGFTTRGWQGGGSRKKWVKQHMQPICPGRLCDLLHIIYRDAVAPLDDWNRDIVLVTSEAVLRENIDGEAILWAAGRAERFAPSTWICLSVTDGAPVDDATIQANGGGVSSWFLQRHLDQVVRDLSSNDSRRIGCLSLAPEGVPQPYRVLVETGREPELAPVRVFDVLERLIWPASLPADKVGVQTLDDDAGEAERDTHAR